MPLPQSAIPPRFLKRLGDFVFAVRGSSGGLDVRVRVYESACLPNT